MLKRSLIIIVLTIGAATVPAGAQIIEQVLVHVNGDIRRDLLESSHGILPHVFFVMFEQFQQGGNCRPGVRAETLQCIGKVLFEEGIWMTQAFD